MAQNLMEAFEDAVAKFGERQPEIELATKQARKPRPHYDLHGKLERLFSKGKQAVHNLSNDGVSDFVLTAIEGGKFMLHVLSLDGASVRVATQIAVFDLKQAADIIEFDERYSGSLGRWRKL